MLHRKVGSSLHRVGSPRTLRASLARQSPCRRSQVVWDAFACLPLGLSGTNQSQYIQRLRGSTEHRQVLGQLVGFQPPRSQLPTLPTRRRPFCTSVTSALVVWHARNCSKPYPADGEVIETQHIRYGLVWVQIFVYVAFSGDPKHLVVFLLLSFQTKASKAPTPKMTRSLGEAAGDFHVPHDASDGVALLRRDLCPRLGVGQIAHQAQHAQELREAEAVGIPGAVKRLASGK